MRESFVINDIFRIANQNGCERIHLGLNFELCQKGDKPTPNVNKFGYNQRSTLFFGRVPKINHRGGKVLINEYVSCYV